MGRELEQRGYLFIDFCDLIKQDAARALSAISKHTAVEEIRKNKDKYRPFLQVLGELIGFNNEPWYVQLALRQAGWQEGRRAVFDNVRTPEQFQVLQPYGFTLVRLDTALLTRLERAQKKYDVSLHAFMEQDRHPIETGAGLGEYISLSLDSSQPVARIVDILMTTNVQEGSLGASKRIS